MRIGNQEDGEIGTVVGVNVRLQGTIKDSNDITVHGTVEGEVVSSKTITITESAMIKGPVSGETVVISGNVKGSIEGKSKIEILATGKVNGSTSTSTLIIHAGAVFNGKSTMPEGEAKAVNGQTEEVSEEKDENKEEEYELK